VNATEQEASFNSLCGPRDLESHEEWDKLQDSVKAVCMNTRGSHALHRLQDGHFCCRYMHVLQDACRVIVIAASRPPSCAIGHMATPPPRQMIRQTAETRSIAGNLAHTQNPTQIGRTRCTAHDSTAQHSTAQHSTAHAGGKSSGLLLRAVNIAACSQHAVSMQGQHQQPFWVVCPPL
jgi:hypothetical protein